MALNDELRQRLVLVLQKQGTEAIDEVKARINDLKGEFERSGQALRDAFLEGNASILEFQASTRELTAEYRELGKLIKEVEKAEVQAAEAAGQAQRLRIEAYAAADRELERYQKHLQQVAEDSAMEQHLREQAEIQEALRKLEERSASERVQNEAETRKALEAGTDAVRERMKAIEEARMAEGKAMRERIEAYAREERRDEQDLADRRRRYGDYLRARIEAHARLDEYNEEQRAKEKARMEEELKAAESLANQKALYERLAKKQLNDEQVKNLERLTVSIKDTTKFTDEFVQKFNSIEGGLTRSEQKSKQAAMGFLALAHAAQDAQYGFGAVINNIPQITYAFTQQIEGLEKYSMAISGGAMLIGVAINTLGPKLISFSTDFARSVGIMEDPAKKFAITSEDLKAKLQALTDKPFKVAVDYEAIERTTKQIERLEQATRTYQDLLNKPTSVEEESGKLVKEALDAGGGMKNVDRAIRDAMRRQGNLVIRTPNVDEFEASKRELESIEKRMSGPLSSPQEAISLANRRATLEPRIRELEQKIKQETDNRIAGIISDAASGKGDAIQNLFDLYMGNKDIFQRAGVGNPFAAGLLGAMPENVRAARDNEAFIKRQEDEAKRAKSRENDLIDDLNRQGKSHDPEIDAWQKKMKMIKDWVQDEYDVDFRLKRATEKEQGKAERAGIRDQNANARENRAAAKALSELEKAAQIQDLARKFEAAGFAPDAAKEGGRLAAQRINRGDNPQAAMELVYRQMIKSAAQQEQALGLLGQATQIMMMLEQRDRMTQARLDMIQGKMNQTRSKRRSLQPTLPPN